MKFNKQIYIGLGIIAFVLIWNEVSRFVKKKKAESIFSGDAVTQKPAPNPISEINRDKQLGVGIRGPEVRELQSMLNADGATPALSVDGIFGPKTKAALMKQLGVDFISLNDYAKASQRVGYNSMVNSLSGIWNQG